MFKSLNRTWKFLTQHPLTSKNPLLAIMRFAKVQMQLRMAGNTTTVLPWTNGLKVVAKKGLTGITGNLYAGLHEVPEMTLLLHILRPGDLFADVGANVGSYTLLATGLAGAHAVSFEPAPSTFAILSENIRINNLQNRVVLRNNAVGSAPGELIFRTDMDTTNHVVEAEGDHTVRIESVVLDNILDKVPIVMKIDVEGYETEVVAGAHRILEDPALKVLVIELNGSGGRYGFDEDKLHEYFLGIGFQSVTYDPFERKITVLKGRGDFNSIYVRDIPTVQQLVLSAPVYTIHGSRL